MGALAARTVLKLAGGERIESLRFELPTQLVVRDSTGPAGH
jgi:LacI family transcriptional regulator